ncbi:MAG: NYN domain-containing protein [Gemmatimonadota bacterium]
MNVPYTRAPHQAGPGIAGPDASHAALLIDFDNVTMGMRSDLSKELKSLLDSDVIKGKVSVQRAYADWRRYPQYIVPLSEASVDLIFAPAYGSNKKNATDIRMAIDALELVFIRPEIGTYILLTGDSDFSSLVLKLKEYGKYVIGVGIQESSSDILVQNCDEYYSYTSLTGLTKTTELDRTARDPWVLVKDSVAKMVQRGDVMRSDRLKQVMQEIDPTFDEGAIGFSKFSKFLAEASSRGLLQLKKLENGQYEVGPGRGRSRSDEGGRSRGGRSRSRSRGRGRGERRGSSSAATTDNEVQGGEEQGSDDKDPIAAAYDVLRDALEALKEAGRDPVRDSDVKRKILERDRGFDETELGFPKFSKFLEQAREDGVISLVRTDAGNLDVSLLDEAEAAEHDDADDGPAAEEPGAPQEDGPSDGKATVIDVEPPKRGLFGFRLGPRRGSTRRRGGDDASSIFGFGGTAAAPESTGDASSDDDDGDTARGTGVAAAELAAFEASEAAEADYDLEDLRTDDDAVDYGDHGDDDPVAESSSADASPSEQGSDVADAPPPDVPLDQLGLPSEPGAIARYLTHRYKGVGEKTAETLVERLGADLFRAMHERPEEIATIIPPKRAEQLLEAWRADYARRASGSKSNGSKSGGSGGRRGGRSRSRGRGRG